MKSTVYSGLARGLARRGFTVFASDFDARDFGFSFLMSERINASLKCSPLGVLPSVSAFHTMVGFVAKNGYGDVSRAMMLGHSFGANVLSASFYRLCNVDFASLVGPVVSKLVCNGANTSIPPYRAVVLVVFDGLRNITDQGHPDDTLLLAFRSQFVSDIVVRASELLKTGRANAIDVEMDANVNHFGPNDFAPAFNHLHTNCSRMQAKGKDFRTTSQVQAAVVRSLAGIIAATFYSYQACGNNVVRSIAEVARRMSYVKKATVAADASVILFP